MLVLIAVCPLAGATCHCPGGDCELPQLGAATLLFRVQVCKELVPQPRMHLHPGMGFLAGGEQLFFFFFFNAAEKLVCTQQRECLHNFYSSKAFFSPSWPDGRGGTQVASRLSAEAG